MRVLIISDGHGDIEKLDSLSSEFEKADFVLYAGDFAEFGKTKTGLPYLKKLTSMHKEIFAVIGNCDKPNFLEKLEEHKINAQKTIAYYKGLVISGSGGGSKFTGLTPNERSDKDLVSDLDLVVKAASEKKDFWENLIIISHNPPKNTKLDQTTSGVNVGSPLLRNFIETYKPLLVVSGHIHESVGTDTIGKTMLVNPGSLLNGNYAIAEIIKEKENSFKVSKIELKQL